MYRPFLHTKKVSRADHTSFRCNVWRTFLRPALAFLAACGVAALLLIATFLLADNGLEHGMGRIPFTVMDALIGAAILGSAMSLLLALPVWALVVFVRQRGWPRPLADIGLAATLPFIGAALFFASQYSSLGAALQGVLTAFTFLPAGAAGGFVYWWLAGRPREAAMQA